LTDWTLEQAAELVLEQMLELLDECDDEDTIRPQIVFDALAKTWAPHLDVASLDEGTTAGQIRERIQRARFALAQGARIP
jgi:hypothetical protein